MAGGNAQVLEPCSVSGRKRHHRDNLYVAECGAAHFGGWPVSTAEPAHCWRAGPGPRARHAGSGPRNQEASVGFQRLLRVLRGYRVIDEQSRARAAARFRAAAHACPVLVEATSYGAPAQTSLLPALTRTSVWADDRCLAHAETLQRGVALPHAQSDTASVRAESTALPLRSQSRHHARLTRRGGRGRPGCCVFDARSPCRCALSCRSGPCARRLSTTAPTHSQPV